MKRGPRENPIPDNRLLEYLSERQKLALYLRIQADIGKLEAAVATPQAREHLRSASVILLRAKRAEIGDLGEIET